MEGESLTLMSNSRRRQLFMAIFFPSLIHTDKGEWRILLSIKLKVFWNEILLQNSQILQIEIYQMTWTKKSSKKYYFMVYIMDEEQKTKLKKANPLVSSYFNNFIHKLEIYLLPWKFSKNSCIRLVNTFFTHTNTFHMP